MQIEWVSIPICLYVKPIFQVTAKKRDFLTGSETLTTMFVYVFENVTCDSTSEAVSNAQSSLQIMPEGYREFLLYLEGRRAMQRLENIA
jgi:hypothetical protein